MHKYLHEHTPRRYISGRYWEAFKGKNPVDFAPILSD
jgi:hypothetical protein